MWLRHRIDLDSLTSSGQIGTLGAGEIDAVFDVYGLCSRRRLGTRL